MGRLAMDSRKVKPGMMFVVLPSANSDVNSFIPQAAENGASAVLTFSEAGFDQAIALGISAALLPVDQYNDSLWKLCKIAFDDPSASMKIIGVTGTNGKTTTCWLIRDMLQALGLKAGYIGTLGFQIPGGERELQNTTPFAIELNELLAEARDAGVEAIAMEVSSHALAEKRADGVEFDVGVFTNLTQDHLDFHGSMEEYAAAKLRLFTELPKQSSKNFLPVINVGDDLGAIWAAMFPDAFTFSVCGPVADLRVPFAEEGEEIYLDQLVLVINPLGSVNVPLGGRYNVENLLAAISSVVALNRVDAFINGEVPDAVLDAAEQVRPVPGRFEPVSNEAGITILVDYAHTPDALEKLLETVRLTKFPSWQGGPPANTGITTVFGCGGDRDKAKRSLMAKVASERSDLTVVTSDNPRTEDPQAIIDAVMTGITSGRKAVAILDRGEAIRYAVERSRPGDTIVIAGKGHENYQIIGRTKHPMDDRELAKKGIQARKART